MRRPPHRRRRRRRDAAAVAAGNAVQFSAAQGGNADVKGKKIVNVAAGTANTDAVNVAQLKAAGLSTDTSAT